jgi:hypothetical protein
MSLLFKVEAELAGTNSGAATSPSMNKLQDGILESLATLKETHSKVPDDDHPGQESILSFWEALRKLIPKAAHAEVNLPPVLKDFQLLSN